MFYIVSTFALLLASFGWRSDDLLNWSLKFGYFVLALWSAFEGLRSFGYIIKV